jgi:hypothetical protein
MVAEKLTGFLRPQPGGPSSTLIVYRRADAPCDRSKHALDVWSPFQTPFAPSVAVDGQTVGDLRRGEFLRFALSPGDHLVVVDPVPPFRRFEAEGLRYRKSDPASLAVRLDAGHTVYAETWVCGETYQTSPRFLTYLESRDADLALSALTDLKAAWP